MKAQRYDHQKIEKKWQKEWAKKKLYKTAESKGKKKCYVLDMFPYPSGEGLHVGHPRGYIGTDIYSRFKKMQGFNVLHPMGWDAFGLPAEQFAIKHKVHPEIAVKKNVKRYKEQLSVIGFNYDWDREVSTTDPAFYKWTQWTFLKMLEKGLAYESFEPINWCPSCQTGLANEDLEAGKCERCGSDVEQKPMRQWVLKITKYADRMLADLDGLNWPQSVKESQRNWIGRSEGALFDFAITSGVKRFVLLHGYTGTPERNFFPWLKALLERYGYEVIVPALPNTKNPTIAEQVEYVLKNISLEENTALLGHSMGGAVALKIAEIKKLAKLILVDAVSSPIRVTRQTKYERTFDWQFDWENIRANTKDVVVLSDTTPGNDILPLHAERIAQALSVTVRKIKAEEIHICATEEPEVLKACVDTMSVFTTRADTLFGVTYVVLAPEHPLIEELRSSITNWDVVEKYIAATKYRSEIERTAEKKDKTGVELKGVTAINPATGEAVPVWIADYVLVTYGTGAVMAVPAHDERDFEFAQNFKLPIKTVIEPYFERHEGNDAVKSNAPFVLRRAVVSIIKHWEKDEYLLSYYKKNDWRGFIVGGIEGGESLADAGIREIQEETGYQNVRHVRDFGALRSRFYHEVKEVNRDAHFEVAYFELTDGVSKEMSAEEKALHTVVWVPRADVAKTLNREDMQQAWNFYIKGSVFTNEGTLVNSKNYTNLSSAEAKKELTEAFGRAKISYKLKDWVFSRQRYWGEPIPVIHCLACARSNPSGHGVVPVPEKDLPVLLPKVKSYEPSGTGESPLATIDKWVNVKCPKCKSPAKRETNTMPQWAGSSWYYLRYIDPKNKKALVDKKKEKYWSPVDMYVGGTEHATRHLIYARFWHKFLYDIKVVNHLEPFTRLQNQGLIMASDGRKMSKRWGNVINPDDIVKTYGADTLRVYEMFMGPFDQSIAWNTDSIMGARRFLEKVWRLQFKVSKSKKLKAKSSDLEKLLHKTIKKVGADIETMSFNTAISAMMILVNEMDKAEAIDAKHFALFVQLLAPFAPHIADELWMNLGHKKSIHVSAWPKFDAKKTVDDTFTLVVQINGKVRAQIVVAAEATEAEIRSLVLADAKIAEWVAGKEIKKFIYVRGKLVSIVI